MVLRLLLIVVAVGMVVSNRDGLLVDDDDVYCCNMLMRFLLVGMRLLRQEELTIEQPAAASSITRSIVSVTAAWSLVLYEPQSTGGDIDCCLLALYGRW